MLVVLLFPIYAQSGLKQINIDVFEESVVKGESYTIGEIANINGYDVELTKQISEILVGPSPRPGKSLRVNQAFINARLRKYKSSYEININVPQNSLISRASLRVKAKDILSLVEEQIKTNPVLADKNYQLVGSLRDVFLPTGTLDYKISSGNIGSNPPPVISYQIELSIDGVRKRIQSMMFKRQNQVVAVPPKQLNNGYDEDENNFSEQGFSVTNSQANLNTVRKNNRQKALSTANLNATSHTNTGLPDQQGFVIKSGTRMRLVFSKGNMNLVSEGITTRHARIGDIIELINVQSSKRIAAKIISPTEATIL